MVVVGIVGCDRWLASYFFFFPSPTRGFEWSMEWRWVILLRSIGGVGGQWSGGWDCGLRWVVGRLFFLFSLSNTWICVVGGVEVGGFVLICWWCGGLVEWWWVGFCQFVGGCLDLLGCEIWRLKFHFTGIDFNFLGFQFAGFVFLFKYIMCSCLIYQFYQGLSRMLA